MTFKEKYEKLLFQERKEKAFCEKEKELLLLRYEKLKRSYDELLRRHASHENLENSFNLKDNRGAKHNNRKLPKGNRINFAGTLLIRGY
jgi:hypothetical protein